MYIIRTKQGKGLSCHCQKLFFWQQPLSQNYYHANLKGRITNVCSHHLLQLCACYYLSLIARYIIYLLQLHVIFHIIVRFSILQAFIFFLHSQHLAKKKAPLKISCTGHKGSAWWKPGDKIAMWNWNAAIGWFSHGWEQREVMFLEPFLESTEEIRRGMKMFWSKEYSASGYSQTELLWIR